MGLHWKHGAPQVVFITGGGSGIGREFARRLAQEGASVAIFNRRLAPAVVEELRALARSPQQQFSLNPAVTPPPSSPQAVLAARSSGQCDHRYSATDKPNDPPA